MDAEIKDSWLTNFHFKVQSYKILHRF